MTSSGIHLCGLGYDQQLLMHSVLSSSSWSTAQAMRSQTGGPERFTTIACTTALDELFLFAASPDAKGIWGTALSPAGWHPFSAVAGTESVSNIVGLAATQVGQNTHVLWSTSDQGGSLWHLAAYLTPTASPLNVKSKTGNPGVVRALAAATCAGEVHVTALAAEVAANWQHTILHGNGSWQPFGDALAATHYGKSLSITALAAAGVIPVPQAQR